MSITFLLFFRLNSGQNVKLFCYISSNCVFSKTISLWSKWVSQSVSQPTAWLYRFISQHKKIVFLYHTLCLEGTFGVYLALSRINSNITIENGDISSLSLRSCSHCTKKEKNIKNLQDSYFRLLFSSAIHRTLFLKERRFILVYA